MNTILDFSKVRAVVLIQVVHGKLRLLAHVLVIHDLFQNKKKFSDVDP